jgi:hypothetical protein
MKKTEITLTCIHSGHQQHTTKEELARQHEWVQQFIKSKLEHTSLLIRWYWNIRLKFNPFIQAYNQNQF